MKKFKQVDYIPIPSAQYIKFKCPSCNNEVKIYFSHLDYVTYYWGDDAWFECSECGQEFKVGDIITIKE